MLSHQIHTYRYSIQINIPGGFFGAKISTPGLYGTKAYSNVLQIYTYMYTCTSMNLCTYGLNPKQRENASAQNHYIMCTQQVVLPFLFNQNDDYHRDGN